jgi:tryptophan-rich sensory protein
MNLLASGDAGGPSQETDRAARSVWVLLAFLVVSVIVLDVSSRALGPLSLDIRYAGDAPLWELPLSVRTTIWYVEVLLISAAGWLLWAYPRPGLRTRAVALVLVNLLLVGVVRPVLLSAVPGQGEVALWLIVAAIALLTAILTIAAVGLVKTHRISALLIVPCILWTLYVIAVFVARAVAA